MKVKKPFNAIADGLFHFIAGGGFEPPTFGL